MSTLQYLLQQYTDQHERRKLLVASLQCKTEASADAKNYKDLIASNTKIIGQEQNQLQLMKSISNRCTSILGNVASSIPVSGPKGNLLELWKELDKDLKQQEKEIQYLIAVAKEHRYLEQRLEELKCKYKVYTEIQTALNTVTVKEDKGTPKEIDGLGKLIEMLSRQQNLLEHTSGTLDKEMEETQRLLNQIVQM